MSKTFSVTVSDEALKCLAHDFTDIDAEIQRRIEWAVNHKAGRCLERLLSEGLQLLDADPSVTSIPKDKGELAEVIFAHPRYKNRAQREATAA